LPSKNLYRQCGVAFSMCRKEPKICESLEMDRRLLRIAFELEAFASASKVVHSKYYKFINKKLSIIIWADKNHCE
jgi:hypothetical protein